MSRVLVLVDYECCTKQTFCYFFHHGLSRDVGGFQKTRDFFLVQRKKNNQLYITNDGVLNVFLN